MLTDGKLVQAASGKSFPVHNPATGSCREGGTRVGNLGYFVAPTVRENTTPDIKVIREGIFGPVVCAQSFKDDAAARRIIGQPHPVRQGVDQLS